MRAILSLYNTRTKQVEHFIPWDARLVTMYTCGPTVYHFAHIGNLRTYIMEDVLEKCLMLFGYSVKRAMNITDVGHLASDADTGEDKMLTGARRENKSVMDIAQHYTKAFFADCEKLNIKKPEIVVAATSCIAHYIEVIQDLLDKGYAYISGGNVYFDTSKLNDYYRLNKQNVDELMVASRESVTEDESKRSHTDFVLWFTRSKFQGQELVWESPWGMGYPGWHIECSAIAIHTLGEYLDIHCGGVDNIFPHHTNEIAQSEAYLQHDWCKYWFHVNHLTLASGKMSKSSGKMWTLKDLEDRGYDPVVFRLMCLQSHYRKPLEFSLQTLDNAVSAYKKLKKRIEKLQGGGASDWAMVEAYKAKFAEALGSDLNTALAISVVYDALKDDIGDQTKLDIIGAFDAVLSLNLLQEAVPQQDDGPQADEAHILQKIEERTLAKKEKRYQDADAIRKALFDEGVFLTDTAEGTAWERV